MNLVIATLLTLVWSESISSQSRYEEEVARIQSAAIAEATARFEAMVVLPEAEFSTRWAALFDGYRFQLDAVLDAHDVDGVQRKRADAPLLYGIAWGRAVYANYHRQAAGGDPRYQPSATYFDYLDLVDLADPALLDISDYTDFLVAHARHAGMLMSETDAIWRNGDHRALRASLAVAGAYGHPQTRCAAEIPLLFDAIESYGFDGLEGIAETVETHCPEATDRISAARAEASSRRESVERIVYKTVEDAELALYVLGDSEEGARRPVLIWFHGGGMSQGAWYWCAPCSAYRDAGWQVISVEYRLFFRHGSGPAEGIEDSLDALRHVITHADSLGIDPERIVTGGFSIGGNLAIGAGVFPQAEDVRPAAALSFSGCISWSDDPLARTRVAHDADLGPLGAANWLDASMPPVFFAHGMADPTCSPGIVEDFVRDAESLGVHTEFRRYDDGNHFFLLARPEDGHDAVGASRAFLANLGLTAER